MQLVAEGGRLLLQVQRSRSPSNGRHRTTKLGISFVYMMPFHHSELRRAFRDLYRQCSIIKTITYFLNVATLTNLLV